MSKHVKEMIYLKENRIIMSLDKHEYDVTEYLSELVEELAKLKAR